MQTIALRTTTTLVDDAIKLAKRIGRAIVQFEMAPIERIAHASDVAGVLEQRRADKRAPRGGARNGRRCNPRNCPLSPFAGLSELT
ncbi:hypothetical protein ACFFWD_26690 [Bradyrhizobium erythrophlei]|uniref:hypothetical protein n=1 Tax=Bradyrhizobium erythrophlei TaxID=1437360 RepID=UPI0035F02E7F